LQNTARGGWPGGTADTQMKNEVGGKITSLRKEKTAQWSPKLQEWEKRTPGEKDLLKRDT